MSRDTTRMTIQQRDHLGDAERHVDRDDQHLVGQRIEIGAEFGLHAEALGQEAVDRVADGGGQEQQEGQPHLSAGDRPDDHRHEEDARQRDEIRNTQTSGPGSPARRLATRPGSALRLPPEYIGHRAIAHVLRFRHTQGP